VSSRPDYLAANDAFYSTFWKTAPNYGARFPNAEESARAGVVLDILARVAERDDWAARLPRILDAGCGRGWLTNLLSAFGDAEGCEPVGDAAALARTLFPSLTFHALTPGELARMAWFRPYDVVVCSEVLEHVPTELQRTFISDLCNCVRREGVLVLTTPRGELHAEHGSSEQLIEAWRTEGEVKSLLLAAGFVDLERHRAWPTGSTLFERVIRRLPTHLAQRLRTSSLQAAIDHHTALYQIWYCRRPPTIAGGARGVVGRG
jgi:2-polyprenyl-3-methyl-5-hydroxy-6-metoxy-1,4-benzoquinol methylase